MSTNKRGYHHGDLRETLIRTSLELISEVGLEGFSVAKVAKRAGVSSGAPYRHFPNRESLLAATTAVLITNLTSRMQTTVNDTGKDPIDRLALTAGVCVQYAIEYNFGFELFAVTGDVHSAEPEPYERSREMMDFLISLVQEVKPHAEWSEIIELMEAHLAISQGYVDMYHQGKFFLPKEKIVERATTAARYLIQGWKAQQLSNTSDKK